MFQVCQKYAGRVLRKLISMDDKRHFQTVVALLRQKKQKQNRHVLLVLDMCSAHKVQGMHLAAVKVLFLSANATAKLQTCDVGVIRNVKVHYRTEMVRNLLAHIDCGGKARDYKMSLLDVVHILKRSWDKVTPATMPTASTMKVFVIDQQMNLPSLIVKSLRPFLHTCL